MSERHYDEIPCPMIDKDLKPCKDAFEEWYDDIKEELKEWTADSTEAVAWITWQAARTRRSGEDDMSAYAHDKVVYRAYHDQVVEQLEAKHATLLDAVREVRDDVVMSCNLAGEPTDCWVDALTRIIAEAGKETK